MKTNKFNVFIFIILWLFIIQISHSLAQDLSGYAKLIDDIKIPGWTRHDPPMTEGTANLDFKGKTYHIKYIKRGYKSNNQKIEITVSHDDMPSDIYDDYFGEKANNIKLETGLKIRGFDMKEFYSVNKKFGLIRVNIGNNLWLSIAGEPFESNDILKSFFDKIDLQELSKLTK